MTIQLDITRETVQEAIREIEGQWLKPASRQLLKALEWAVEGQVEVPIDERLVTVGAKLVHDSGRIRELGELLECAQGDCADALQQLKIMTEDRDEYAARLRERRACQCTLPIANAVNLLVDATEDEQAIALAFVRKLMGEGRTEHGALDLATDERDLMGEAKDELDDSISYLLMVRRRMEVLRK